MISIISIGILGVLALLSFYLLKKDNNRRSPPGPWGLPVLGSLLSLQPQIHLTFKKWEKQYGPIVSVKLGQVNAIILSDVKDIREAFSQNVFSGRPDTKLFNFVAGGKHGIVNSDGQEWVEQRRFTLRTLREFGFGKHSMESTIMDEVSDILDWMKQNEGKPVSVNNKFSLAVVNALMTITTGKRFDHEDPELKRLIDISHKAFTEAASSGVLWFLPQLATLMPWFFGWDKITRALTPFQEMFTAIVNDHVKNGSTDRSESTDFTDAYLQEVKATTDPNSSFYKETGLKSCAAVLSDLFGAGSDTSTAMLAWLILYLIRFPEAQAKLQAEVDQVTGRGRAPCLADRPNTPYTESVIHETMRIAAFVPFGVFHSVLEDTEFRGYFIPKDTVIIPNLYGVQHSVQVWGDPENYRPERFLTDDGKSVKKNEGMVAFSVGKRVCAGEPFARDQLYLFLTHIFHKYQAIADPSDPNPTLEPKGGFVLEPKQFTVIFKERPKI